MTRSPGKQTGRSLRQFVALWDTFIVPVTVMEDCVKLQCSQLLIVACRQKILLTEVANSGEVLGRALACCEIGSCGAGESEFGGACLLLNQDGPSAHMTSCDTNGGQEPDWPR